jgi:acyl-CoA synthetase (AMP-forming)/AMP-acid ligase II
MGQKSGRMKNQNINAANLILDDCEFVDITGARIPSTEIANRKNFFKHEIYRLLNGNTFGASIFIDHNHFDFIVPCLKAGWELGCNIFVHDFHPGYAEHPDFKNFYNFISLTVSPQMNQRVERFNLSKANLPLDQYNEKIIYPDIDYKINGVINEDTVAVKTHTSGTTGMPKIIDYSHKLVYHLSDNIKTLFNFSANDRPLHWKTLHHSSLFLNYAIPLLNTCKIHYHLDPGLLLEKNYDPGNYSKLVFPFVAQEKITRVLIPYDWIQFFDQHPSVDLGGITSIHVIRGLNKQIAEWILTNFNPKEIIDKTLKFYSTHSVRIESVEGFLRQIISWREYSRML